LLSDQFPVMMDVAKHSGHHQAPPHGEEILRNSDDAATDHALLDKGNA